MTIEQCLMCSAKTQGGLINITHNESTKAKWLLSAHVVARYTDALRSLTDTFTGIWFEQHRDVRPGNVKQYQVDFQTFVSFLTTHNPFLDEEDHELRNIATGLIADEWVNAENAVKIGQAVQDKLTDQ